MAEEARPVLEIHIRNGNNYYAVNIDNVPLASEVVRGIGGAVVGVATILWLKIDSIHLGAVARSFAAAAAGAGAGAALTYFWMKNGENTEGAIINAVEERPANGAHDRDPEVREFVQGCILVKLRCHTLQSLLQFISDYESGRVKRRLEEELSNVGYKEKLSVTIKTAKEVEEHKKKLRYVQLLIVDKGKDVKK